MGSLNDHLFRRSKLQSCGNFIQTICKEGSRKIEAFIQETKMTDANGAKVDLGVLEEDDEFEEFPADESGSGTGEDEEKDVRVWEDNWDDDTVEDDFSNQLRAELESQGNKMSH